MRREIILPSLALVGGAIGFGLRKWELATAFESDTGLAIAGAPSTLAIVLFSVVMVALFALLCRNKNARFDGYDQAFTAKGNTLYMVVMVTAAFIMVAAGVLEVLNLPEVYAQAAARATIQDGRVSALTMAPQILLAALTLASAWCVLMIGRNNYRGIGHGKYNVALLIPSYAACIWLMVAYQARSGDPVVLDYAWLLFAVVGTVLGTYFMAGFSFERAKPYRAGLTMLCASYFILVTLADAHKLSMLLLYVAFLLYLLASVTTLLFNADRPRMPERVTETATTDELEDYPHGE